MDLFCKVNFLLTIAIREGYRYLRWVPGKGLCAIHPMIFMWGLLYDLDETGYRGRYCFANLRDAIDALKEWDGKNDPPGAWIARKGDYNYNHVNWKEHQQRR